MRSLTDRDQLAAEFRAARNDVYAAIQGLNEDQMSRPAADGWSVKDHLSHLTVWHEFRFYEISRVARGGGHALAGMSDADIDKLNEMLVTPRRALSIQQVVEDLEFARELVLSVIANAPESALDESRYGEAGLRGGAEHDLEHAQAIRALREREGI